MLVWRNCIRFVCCFSHFRSNKRGFGHVYLYQETTASTLDISLSSAWIGVTSRSDFGQNRRSSAHRRNFTKLKSDKHLIWIKTQTKIQACLLFYFCIQHECELIWIWRAVSSLALTPCVFWRWRNQATRPYTTKSRWTFCVGAFEQSQSFFLLTWIFSSIWEVRTYICVTTNDHVNCETLNLIRFKTDVSTIVCQ